MVMTAIPIAPDESEMRTGMLIPEPPATEKASAHWKKNEDIFWSALDEDFRLGERVQSTLRSGADRDLLYGRYEHLLAKWHAALDRAIAA